MLLEIAVFDIGAAIVAAKAGAHRLELCANPAEGGITPSYGTLVAVREKIDIPVFPIIRPRGGDFLYSEEEFEVMRKDVLLCKQLGFEGVVLGLLSADGTIDMNRTAALVDVAYPMDVTFHRAFDRVIDPFKALEAIINCGCQRILTSGLVPTAWDGKQLIKALITAAENRIEIMPGSGVRSHNIKALAEFTRATEFHSAAKIMQPSAMQYQASNMQENNDTFFVDADDIQQMLLQLNSIA
jgi:copper homeostasis protein